MTWIALAEIIVDQGFECHGVAGDSKSNWHRSVSLRPLFSRTSAHCFLQERANPCLVGGGQFLQREGGRPHVAFVEVRLVAEAERCVPRLELLRGLEEADDAAVLGIR